MRSQLTDKGRKPPLGGCGWISSPERRETAMKSHSPGANERLVDTESGHPEAIWRSAGTDPKRKFGPKAKAACYTSIFHIAFAYILA